ncbi:DUF4831 family protein [uncultured Phocaeicola sp.]|uniref:DUF4831 family protein n=1 Tax=uncultured Phocaeicola sp. TaxID=990718 RepID=UPI0025CFAF1B|nr:DUF4831 family protein [uncultured Phocaeicola sp.]
MKKGIIALGLLLASTAAYAQESYTPGKGEGIAYFLPKTALEVRVIATKVTYQPGEFCQYANRYLRLNNITAQPETHWEIKKIEVCSVGVPDSTKAYIMKLKDKDLASNMELTDNGIIKAINTSAPAMEESQYVLEKPQQHQNARKYLTEEILMAGSTAKMAELTAKEIFNIRESKNLILRGQAENMPKDGASLQLVIDNLNQQEQAMTEMFTGITDREDKVFKIQLSPENGLDNVIALRFSKKLGILDSEDLSGEPIYINMTSKTALGTEDEKSKQPKGVLYNIPGKANVSVTFKGKTVFEDELPVTQLGYTEVLTNSLFDKKVNTRVIFNPNTGAIVKIDKD